MAKRKRRKATLRSAGKATESDILERAKAIAEDPTLIMPQCEGRCVLFSPVTSARKGIARVYAAREDEAKLSRLANGGNDLARAYAATLLVAKAGKIPYVAEMRLPTGNVPYVIRGKAKPFFLAGVQNYDDRALRLLSYFPWARKRRMHFFSADRGVVCTGKRAEPPRDFVEEEMDELGLEEREKSLWTCGHGGAGPGRDAVRVTWKAAGVEMERCDACLGKDSMVHSVLRHMVGPRLIAQFDIEVRLAPVQTPKGQLLAVVPALPPNLKAGYFRGVANDAKLLEEARAMRVEALKGLGRAFVAGERAFDDLDSFLAALNPSPAEETALRAGLQGHAGPVALDKATVARALHQLWPERGLVMLTAAAGGDESAAKALFKEKVAADEAADLVRRAGRQGSAQAALRGLPRYARLPPAAGVADAIVRAYRSGGAEAALRTAQERANAGRAKGVALAFLLHLGSGKGQEWRFAQTDQEIAHTLAPVVARLLSENGDGYHQALREASLLAGEPADFQPQG